MQNRQRQAAWQQQVLGSAGSQCTLGHYNINVVHVLLQCRQAIINLADCDECLHVQEAAPAMSTAGGVNGSAAELMLDLSAARHAWLAKDALLLLLKTGHMVLAHLTMQAGMVKRIKVSNPIPFSLPPSCPTFCLSPLSLLSVFPLCSPPPPLCSPVHPCSCVLYDSSTRGCQTSQLHPKIQS